MLSSGFSLGSLYAILTPAPILCYDRKVSTRVFMAICQHLLPFHLLPLEVF